MLKKHSSSLFTISSEEQITKNLVEVDLFLPKDPFLFFIKHEYILMKI